MWRAEYKLCDTLCLPEVPQTIHNDQSFRSACSVVSKLLHEIMRSHHPHADARQPGVPAVPSDVWAYVLTKTRSGDEDPKLFLRRVHDMGLCSAPVVGLLAPEHTGGMDEEQRATLRRTVRDYTAACSDTLTALLGEVHAIEIETDAAELNKPIPERSNAFLNACKSALMTASSEHDEADIVMDQIDMSFESSVLHFVHIRKGNHDSTETRVYQLKSSSAGRVRAARVIGLLRRISDMKKYIRERPQVLASLEFSLVGVETLFTATVLDSHYDDTLRGGFEVWSHEQWNADALRSVDFLFDLQSDDELMNIQDHIHLVANQIGGMRL